LVLFLLKTGREMPYKIFYIPLFIMITAYLCIAVRKRIQAILGRNLERNTFCHLDKKIALV